MTKFADNDLLMLCEPYEGDYTNIHANQWISKFAQKKPGPKLVFVSDLSFLNKVFVTK